MTPAVRLRAHVTCSRLCLVSSAGTWDELLEKKGLFAELATKQQKATEEDMNLLQQPATGAPSAPSALTPTRSKLAQGRWRKGVNTVIMERTLVQGIQQSQLQKKSSLELAMVEVRKSASGQGQDKTPASGSAPIPGMKIGMSKVGADPKAPKVPVNVRRRLMELQDPGDLRRYWIGFCGSMCVHPLARPLASTLPSALTPMPMHASAPCCSACALVRSPRRLDSLHCVRDA